MKMNWGRTMIKLTNGEFLPLEMHKVRVVQKLRLPNIDERKELMKEAGYNTFLLQNKDVFLDMLTDSGVNAMSDLQVSSMLRADDAYAGSETFTRLKDVLNYVFDKEYFLPAHQGRACENIIASAFCEKGKVVPMNYHFTTTRAHIEKNGGKVVELITKEGIEVQSELSFKGNMDTDALLELIKERGKENISFLRMEAGTNLIGGQPFSVANLRKVSQICRENDIRVVLDASLLQDNLYFIKMREEEFKDRTVYEIIKEISSLCDIIYFSARKFGFARGGGILTTTKEDYNAMRDLVILYEGFLTYGGMSVREMEAIAQGIRETLDMEVISQGPMFIKYICDEFKKAGVPVVTPAGGLGVHIDAMEFVKHIPRKEYRAGALAAAIYIISGVRGMERGTLGEERDENGEEVLSNMELVRLAMPRRVYTLSQVKYVADRVIWLYKNRDLIGGLRFVEEPETLRFFAGRLECVSDWADKLVEKFKEDFKDSL